MRVTLLRVREALDSAALPPLLENGEIPDYSPRVGITPGHFGFVRRADYRCRWRPDRRLGLHPHQLAGGVWAAP